MKTLYNKPIFTIKNNGWNSKTDEKYRYRKLRKIA